MKITFLGTSHGYPEAHRRCSCILIEVSSRYYILDMGISPIDDMIYRHLSVEKIQAVFITHMHGDHTNGLIPFINLLGWVYTSTNPAIFLPDTTCTKAIELWMSANQEKLRKMDYRNVENGVMFDDGIVKVTAFDSGHIQGAHSYYLEAEGKCVLFTGDLSVQPDQDLLSHNWEKNLDLMVCECAHFSAMAYLPYLKEKMPQRICITHYVPKNIPTMYELTKAVSPQPVLFANDGMELTV